MRRGAAVYDPAEKPPPPNKNWISFDPKLLLKPKTSSASDSEDKKEQ